MFVLGLSLCGVAFPAFELFLGRYAARARGRVQVLWYAALLRVLGVRVTTSVRMSHDSTLWVSNHISWLDIVVLGAQAPMIFVAKSEVGLWPVVGFMARRNGTLLVSRGDAGSSRRVSESMTWLLRQNSRVALFPEGTSTTGESVLRFHARLFGPAIRVGAQTQAVAIAYRGDSQVLAPFVGEDAFLPHLWQLLAEPTIHADLIFCRPVSAADLTRDGLSHLTRSQIADALGPAPDDLAGEVSAQHARC
jgi:1-acyl-sn-glycerol-3-phosphate acyltransferase